MKTIFITGASTGLGKATARLFHAKGWNVIATMRNPEKETELQFLTNVTLLPLDVTNVSQIESTIAEALKTAKIDVVFNNAGYGLVGALESYSDDQITKQIETNLTGVLRVIKSFIPYFRTQRNGLFITTTSVCGFSSNPLSPVYNATKWALEGFSESISYDLAQFNIGIKTVAPGGIKSDFINGMQAVVDKDYDSLNTRLGELFSDGTLIEFTEAEAIAEVVYEAAVDGKDQLRYLAGNDAVKIAGQRIEMGSEIFRIKLRKKLNLSAPELN
ncbi:SDR family oxidoreductase [Dyadobacter psychrotolerans]|uniref:SDR family oxidoreductase n=1 Tax=Dyadobacter psychrotolerans TaxID=2541721 RepID=A0A4R5DWB7_9BACT|nr:SDR family oxidoreductase [Dyadobacter psychrotolerans]TDE15565.1 SDR family oxidoreductase [Dyadobacter psychrotolerans]